MKRKIFKNIKSKDEKRKINFRYTKEEVFNFFKTNIATSILITVAVLFITIGNSFVIGALIGGYLGAKQLEKSATNFSTTHLLLGTSIGATLGGCTLIFTVALGSFFHAIGSILGALSGCGAIIAFAGNLTEKITNRVMKSSFICKVHNNNRKIAKKAR